MGGRLPGYRQFHGRSRDTEGSRAHSGAVCCQPAHQGLPNRAGPVEDGIRRAGLRSRGRAARCPMALEGAGAIWQAAQSHPGTLDAISAERGRNYRTRGRMGASQHTLSATTRVKASPLRWLVVASVFVLAFITIVDRVCISAAKRDIAAELRINDLQFGWVFGAFTLGYAVLMIPGGWLADRFGPRRCLTCIVCLWSAFTMASGAMRALIPLIAVRFLFGLAEAGAYPTASRALYAWMPARERGLALGLLNGGSRVGGALGLPLASYLILGFGWRACFVTLGALGFIWASGWFFWFRDRPAHQSATYSEATPATASGISVIFSQPGALLLFQYFADNFTLFLVYSWMLPYLEQHFHLDPVRAGIYAGLPMYCGAVA